MIHIRGRTWRALDFHTVLTQLRKHDSTLRKIIINDRIDIAIVNDIKRVHLASHSIFQEKVNKYFPDLQYGVSVHDVSLAQQSETAGAQYVIFGHIFATNSKRGIPPRGVHALQQVVQTVSIPVVAIGGITVTNVSDVLRAGAGGIAILSGI